jgi:DNA-binding MarR family transcriptional regulator
MSGDRDDAAQAWRAMRSLVLDLYDKRDAVSDALDMSFIRAKALVCLSDKPLTMRQLAAVLATDAPYTTVVVDDLERWRLAERRVQPEDRRSKLVTVTPAGRKAARVAEKILTEPPPALRALSAADLHALDRILQQLIAEARK